VVNDEDDDYVGDDNNRMIFIIIIIMQINFLLQKSINSSVVSGDGCMTITHA
jgi:hypothetical protein